MDSFEQGLHNMFDHIWDCEIEHPIFDDTVGDLMQAVMQLYNNTCKKCKISAQPKIGWWIKSEIPNEEYVCSECGGACWYYDVGKEVTKSRFCPNCGVKMDVPDTNVGDKSESEDKDADSD